MSSDVKVSTFCKFDNFQLPNPTLIPQDWTVKSLSKWEGEIFGWENEWLMPLPLKIHVMIMDMDMDSNGLQGTLLFIPKTWLVSRARSGLL